MTNSLEPAALLPDHTSGANWRWRMFGADGAETENPVADGASFPSQSDAESWLGGVLAEHFEHGRRGGHPARRRPRGLRAYAVTGLAARKA
ncbi:MAG: hypothetical protein QM655_09140 [Nocardioidaceae bacterium]